MGLGLGISREVMLREDLRLSLPERPCCKEVMLREDLRLSLPERPCCREVMLREDLRLSLRHPLAPTREHTRAQRALSAESGCGQASSKIVRQVTVMVLVRNRHLQC